MISFLSEYRRFTAVPAERQRLWLFFRRRRGKIIGRAILE
jgi:hypothetical protein